MLLVLVNNRFRCTISLKWSFGDRNYITMVGSSAHFELDFFSFNAAEEHLFFPESSFETLQGVLEQPGSLGFNEKVFWPCLIFFEESRHRRSWRAAIAEVKFGCPKESIDCWSVDKGPTDFLKLWWWRTCWWCAEDPFWAVLTDPEFCKIGT